jgi:hypothetical protein
MAEGAPPGDDADLQGPEAIEEPEAIEDPEGDETEEGPPPPPPPAAPPASRGGAKAAVRRVVDRAHEYRHELLSSAALALAVWYPHRQASWSRIGIALLALWAAAGLIIAAARWAHENTVSRCLRFGFGLGGAALAPLVVHDLAPHQGRAVWALIATVFFVPVVVALVGAHLAGIAAGGASIGAAFALAVALFLVAEGTGRLGAALHGDLDETRPVVTTVVDEPSDPPIVDTPDPPDTVPATAPPPAPPTTAPPTAPPAEPIPGPPTFTG